MPQGYLWCKPSANSALVRRYYETDDRFLRWKESKSNAEVAGFFDLVHFCQDDEPVRAVGSTGEKLEDKRDVFRFEIMGEGKNHLLFAESYEERATWVLGLQNTVLAMKMQGPSESTEELLRETRALFETKEQTGGAGRSSSSSSISSSASVSGARTSFGLVLDGNNIMSVVKGSPADSCCGETKVEPNDCLVSVDGKKVEDSKKQNNTVVIDLLRGTDEVGSQARLKFRKKGTLKTTYEVTLWRCDMSRVREVATLYQLTEEQIKNPNKALAQKVADKVAAVERLDFYLLGAAFQHVASLEELIRTTSEAQCKKDKKTADVILQMQALLDAIQAKGDDVDSVDQSPTGNLSHVSPRVKDRLSEVYKSSLVPDAAALQRDVDLLEAEMADAQKANNALKRTISELEHKLEETESKLTHFMHLQGQDKWTGDNDVESMRKENTRLESELKQAKLKMQELDSIGKRLLEQKNPQKEQSSKAVEEISTKLVAVEERWNDTKKLLKEATKREDELLEKSRIAARTQMTLEAQIQNLTNQLNDSTKALMRKEGDTENLQIVMAKQAKQRDNESRTEKNRDLPREDKIKTCSLGEAQPSLYKLERENEILKSQLDALNHKLELALVEKETLAREMVEMTDHLSEQCCKLEIEKSMRENEELTFRDRLRKEQNHIKDKQAAYEKLEEEMLEVMRELDRQRDLVDEKEDCAAKDITEVVGQLNERHQEQMERMVSEREHLKTEIRAHDAEKDNLNDVIRRLELQLKEAQKEKELNMSAVEQRLHSKFHVERGKLEEEVQRKQQLCTEQIRMMESLVASARLEATAEIATGRNERAEIEKELRSSADRCEASLLCIDHLTKEKTVLQGEIKMLNEKRLEANAEITKERHQHKETEKQLRQLIDRCESERECVENLSKEKIVLQGEIKALTEKLEGACNQTFDAEKEIHAAKARHREQIELLEGEIRKIRGAERNLEMKVDEVQLRLDEADKILKESMQLVNATTPLALPRMVAALQKDAEKIVLQGEIKALTEKLEGACKQALDAEKEVQATKARHREQIELLESETRKVRGAERNLELKVDEVQLRLDEADKILKESMQLVNATTPLALPLRITALQNEAAVQNSSEHENLNARAKKAESMLGELSEILNAPDLVSLPHVAVQMGKQRHSLKNAQVQLEEEVRLLRAELESDKRHSKSEISSAQDELKRMRDSLLQAQKERDQYEADFHLAQAQITTAASSVTNLESEVETLSRTVAQQRQKLAELGDERDELMRQIRCAEDDCQKLKKDNSAYDERNVLLEDIKARLEKENSEHKQDVERITLEEQVMNAQLRQELHLKNASIEERSSANAKTMDSMRQELGRLQDEVTKLKDQREMTLRALDALQDEAKGSHVRADRLSSSLDAVEHERNDLLAQRNAAIQQASEARKDTERIRESLMRQQQEIMALQDFIDKHQMKLESTNPADPSHENSVQNLVLEAQRAKLEAFEAEERERRRTKEMMGVVATVWDYRVKDGARRSSSKDVRSDRKWTHLKDGGRPASVSSSSCRQSSSVSAVRDSKPQDPQYGGSLLSTFTGFVSCT